MLKVSTFLLALSFSTITLSSNLPDAMKKSYDFENTKNYSMAIKLITPYAETKKYAYFINLRLGWLFYQSQLYKNAKMHYELAIKEEPLSVNARLGLSNVLAELQDFTTYEKELLVITSNQPHHYEASRRLIYYYMESKLYRSAYKLLKSLINIYPEDKTLIEYSVTLSDILLNKKESQEMKEYIMKIYP